MIKVSKFVHDETACMQRNFVMKRRHYFRLTLATSVALFIFSLISHSNVILSASLALPILFITVWTKSAFVEPEREAKAFYIYGMQKRYAIKRQLFASGITNNVKLVP